MSVRKATIAALIVTVFAAPASAQRAPDADARMDAQREAMERLSWMDGEWSGTAEIATPQGPRSIVQTESIKPALSGTIKLIEGRGFEADGTMSFNAVAVLSYDPGEGTYRMHSYSDGRDGSFVLAPDGSGYSWTIPAGPMTIRYHAEFADGTWHEYGERVVEGQEPQRFIELTVKPLEQRR